MGQAERAEPQLRGRDQCAWLDRLEIEIDNLRAALEWSTREEGDAEDAEVVLRLGGALSWFWYLRGYGREGRAWLERALAVASGPPAVRTRALAGAAWIVHMQQELAAAEPLAEEALTIARQLDDRWSIAWSLHLLGRIKYLSNDSRGARQFADQSLRFAREDGDPWLVAHPIHLLGLAAHVDGDYSTARSFYQESLAIRREIGAQDWICTGLMLMGMAAHSQGDYARARSEYQESLILAGELGSGMHVAHVLAGFAALAAAENQPERAVRLASAALAIVGVAGMTPIPLNQKLLDEALDSARSWLSDDAYAAAWAGGASMSRDEATAEALALDDGPDGAANAGRDSAPHGLRKLEGALERRIRKGGAT